jgi:hypothetical protein
VAPCQLGKSCSLENRLVRGWRHRQGQIVNAQLRDANLTLESMRKKVVQVSEQAEEEEFQRSAHVGRMRE